jgi:hypothetical protein
MWCRCKTEGVTDSAYPLPKPSTVRQLYGSAFRCAHPDCSRPLYKVSDETGDLILNSRVAHIHARRKGGPRWLEMPAEQNREFGNLLLLCIEHSYEIDENPDPFPAEVLREWKTAQIAEYEQLQRSWTISEDEASEALVASESFATLHISSAVELVRRIEALRLTARRTRGQVRAWAERWQQLRERTRRSFSAWDEDGNSVYVEPSISEVRPIKDGIQSALETALHEIHPAAEAALIELAAVRATRIETGPWCDALDRAITDVIRTASDWAGGPDPEADASFEVALTKLDEALDAFVRVTRGEAIELPEPSESVSDANAPDAFDMHRALLDEARPYHRVNHRPYDADLRDRVAQATQAAAQLPSTPHLLPFGLDTTAALAVAVAGNASGEDQLDLLERDARRIPTCAAVALLEESARRHGEDSVVGAAALEKLRRVWVETDWANERSWIGNEVNGQAMMYAFARATSDEEVRDRLASALETNPGLLETVVISCAGWVEQLDSGTWEVVGRDRSYRSVPTWFPIQIAGELVTNRHPELSGLDTAELPEKLLRRAQEHSE